MIANIKTLSPTALGQQISNSVTRAIDDQENYFKTGLYPRFLLSGCFIEMNSLAMDKTATQSLLDVLNIRLVEFTNGLLSRRYGPAFLPLDFKFQRSAWMRKLNATELRYLAKLKKILPPDTSEDRKKETRLLVLGAIETVKRDFYNYQDKGLQPASYLKQLQRYCDTLDRYLLTENFIKLNEIIKID